MKFNKKWLWLIIPILIFSLVCLNSSSVSTVLLAIQGAITDGNLVKFSGNNGIGVDTGLSATNVVKCKFDATIAPTINNDISEGYTVGSRWLDITNLKSYVCLDNTDGAAVWIENVVEGDMNKATYDTDEDGDIDVAAGGTEKSLWTLYCIPYLSGTTAFGEIPIGTAGQVLKVSVGATGYEFGDESGGASQLSDLSDVGVTTPTDKYALMADGDSWESRALVEADINDLGTYLENLSEDVTPELGAQLQSGAHSINFTEQVLTSGTAIAWNLGNSNKAILTAAHNFTITITAPSGALNAQVIITQDGTGSRAMDEIITQADATIVEAEVHTDTEIIDLTVDIPTGARIRFKTSGVIPTPLVADTIYWAIRSSENHIQVATTKALAIAGTAVDITDDGTDTQTVQQLVKWTGGTLGVLSTAAGAEDILALTYKTGDKQWYAILSKDFY